MNQETYNHIERISKWISLLFAWGCWGGVPIKEMAFNSNKLVALYSVI